MKEKLKHLFATNTEKNEAHYTSDGICFWEKQHATAHAKESHNDGTVTTVSRTEAEADETDADVLAKIQKRKDVIMDTLKPFEAEWKELTEKESTLLEKIGSENSEETEAEKLAKIKAEADALAAKTALSARALAVDLSEDATEEEVLAAEAAKSKQTPKKK